MQPILEAFKPSGAEQEPVEVVDAGADDVTRVQRALCCAACGRVITDERRRVSVHGADEHRFMNPNGFVFDLGCFSEAPGCRAHGTSTDEFTWFPGYTWRYASCGGCDIHLGWLFEGGEWSHFFGLILNRLTEAEVDSGGKPR